MKIRTLFMGIATVTALSVTANTDMLHNEYENINIEKEVISIKLNYSKVTLKKGRSYKMKCSISPKDATNKNIIWTSSNNKIVSVSSVGIIKGVSIGAATITASSEDNSDIQYKCKVTVKKSDIYTYKTGYTSQTIPIDVYERIKGKSFGKDCTVKLSSLRYLRMKYVDFNGKEQNGEMIVNKAIAKDVLEIFYKLYQAKYPIEKMRLVDEYNADDELSMEDNNTSAFNYRCVEGTKTLSKHALGMAVDINPKYNPYVTTKNGKQHISPSNGKAYVDRSKNFISKIYKNGDCYKIFTKKGFSWGGNWKSAKDYQHFYK